MHGRLSVESPLYRYVTWEVPDFFMLPPSETNYLQSPEFHFAHYNYCLRLYPKGMERTYSYVDIILVRLSSCHPDREIWFKLGFLSYSGGELDCEQDDTDIESVGGTVFFVSRAFLLKEKHIYVPGDTLKVFCDMRLSESGVIQWSVSPPPVLDFSCKDPLPAMYENEQKPGLVKLQSDYKELLKGAESDTCLVVSGKEFRAHRCILRARSPVFDAMFEHDTVEKRSGRVVIDDLDPDSFEVFLEYVYTGNVMASCSDAIVLGLYAAGDKYDVPTLKSECVEYMRRNLSIKSFCDVMTLALRHKERELKKIAFKFFQKNMAEIIVTAEWQVFMSENSMIANELLIKAIVPEQRGTVPGKHGRLTTLIF